MKLRLLVFFGLLTGLFVNTQAQAISNEVVFVDAKGNVLAPNATLNLNKVEESLIPGWKQITKKLFFRNTSSKPLDIKLSYTITSIEDGQLQVCALGNCNSKEKVGTYKVGTKSLLPTDKDEEIKTELSFSSKGKCIVTLQLTIKENGTSVEKEGAKITITFDSESTGINSSFIQDNYTYDVFNTKGVLLYKQLTSLSKLPKGIYIIKCKNMKGLISTQKHIVS